MYFANRLARMDPLSYIKVVDRSCKVRTVVIGINHKDGENCCVILQNMTCGKVNCQTDKVRVCDTIKTTLFPHKHQKDNKEFIL